MSLIRINLGKIKPEGFGFMVQDKNGKLIVTQVDDSSNAFEKGLRCNDVIYFLNNEIINESATLFAQKIMQTKGKVQLQIYRANTFTQSQCSYNNISTSQSDQLGSNISQKMKLSRSSIELHNLDFGDHVTDNNFVPDDQIDRYMQSMTSGDNLDDTTDEIQITRKHAYQKVSSDVRGPGSPRFSVKKATKSTSIYSKDPNITIKRRLNNKITSDTITSSRPRPGHSNQINKHVLHSDTPSTVLVNDGSMVTISPDTSAPSQVKASEPNNLGSDEVDGFKSIQIDVNVKILSFKDKIKRPTWKKFMVENDCLGVLFHSLDVDEITMGCNSMAIDPYVSGLSFYMTSWLSNNSVSRFFLPIGQPSYKSEIEVVCAGDNIHVTYRGVDLDFLIDVQRLPEDRAVVLAALLGVDLDCHGDTRPSVQSKTKKYHGSAENLKSERRQKTPRYETESARVTSISSLPQTRLVQNVPLVVVICVNIVETLGLMNEGIYRKSGNDTLRKKLENVVMSESCEKWVNYEEWTNVNVVCSLVKSVLRGLCLIDRDTAIKLSMINLHGHGDMCGGEEQLYMDMVYHLRQRLCKGDVRAEVGARDRPQLERRCRLATFKYVIKHLDRVSRCQEHNKMNGDNLATCFSPTIIEDIPCHDDANYHISKRIDADRNLKQMMAFWITNADLMCGLLEEDDDEVRYRSLVLFCQERDGVTDHRSDMIPPMPVAEKDVASIVRELMEYYLSESFTAICESLSHSVLTSDTTPGMAGRSVKDNSKQSKKEKLMRRSSTSLSPRTNRRDLDSSVVQALSPKTRKKIDNWTTKAIRSMKKDVIPVQKNVVCPITDRLSGSVKNVPLVIDACVKIIRKYGVDVDGIYRVSAKKQDIMALDDLVHSDQYQSWYQEPHLSLWTNMYTVSCLLKTVLRKFPLISKDTWQILSSRFTDKLLDDDLRQLLMTAACHLCRGDSHGTRDSDLTIRLATLRYVLRHLKTVSRHANNSRMTSSSLAVCFTPVLMEEHDPEFAIAVNLKGIQVIEKLIDHSHWIYQWDDMASEDMYGAVMQDSLDDYLRGYSIREAISRPPKIEDYDIFHHNTDSDPIRVILEKLVRQSTSMADSHNRSRRRIHSDNSDKSMRKSDISGTESPEKVNGNAATSVLYKESLL